MAEGVKGTCNFENCYEPAVHRPIDIIQGDQVIDRCWVCVAHQPKRGFFWATTSDLDAEGKN